ncbi:LysM peptidoglycan-binding domain-containing protein [Actinotalea sp. M2MS4P-6]|uniref:LysM peptidoglycan-binding domain-containing protein n=1 Tax=Actinotalea sp. M2MS4P-6 TaxID=2983762 RepID=UPI0021E425BA|nr:LysM peptidoglycan-binding domain-containing protein [Actinotalea sp. M2MS4P-6]MCV2394137.1 LysM peptidoglycan-binding domain-containing protein [Actinotalea sp. M2MS4P-6]
MHQTRSNEIKASSWLTVRAIALAVVLGITTRWLGSLAWSSGLGAVTVDDLVAAAALAVGAIAAGVLTVGCGLLAVAGCGRAAGHTWRAVEALAVRLTPGALRRAIALGLGLGLSAGALPAAAAEPAPSLGWQVTETASPTPAAEDDAASTVAGAVGALDLTGAGQPVAAEVAVATPGEPARADAETASAGESATRPATSDAGPAASAASAGSATSPGADTVVVRHGDSLWALAAAHLPGAPTDAEVARAWPAWYAANREVIGSDPDLLLPGQVLVVPETTP